MPLFHFSRSNQDEEYTAVPVVEVEDLEHTEENPFCPDPRCPCKEDVEAIGRVNDQYQDGLYTGAEATRRVKGWRL